MDSPILPEKGARLDSPILAVKEAHLDSPILPVMDARLDSPFLPDNGAHLDSVLISPVTSYPSTLENFINSPSNSVTGNSPIQPTLKLDASTEMEYVTKSISTQVECFQRNQSTQCGAKINLNQRRQGL